MAPHRLSNSSSNSLRLKLKPLFFLSVQIGAAARSVVVLGYTHRDEVRQSRSLHAVETTSDAMQVIRKKFHTSDVEGMSVPGQGKLTREQPRRRCPWTQDNCNLRSSLHQRHTPIRPQPPPLESRRRSRFSAQINPAMNATKRKTIWIIMDQQLRRVPQ